MIRRLAGPVAAASALALASCGGGDKIGNGGEAARRVTSVQSSLPEPRADSLPGTPMAQRVAVIGLLNKRNGLTNKLTMKPGQALRVGAAIVRLRACEQTAPWEDPAETGAFVQLDVQETRDNKWHRVFSGWLFKDRPDRNVVQHPIYDVWVNSCAMSWPETGPATVKASDARSGDGSAKRSSAKKSADETSGSPGTASDTAVANKPE